MGVKNLTEVLNNEDKTTIEANVTYETLNANGDIGTGANQVAQGNHTHTDLGLFEYRQGKALNSRSVISGSIMKSISGTLYIDGSHHVANIDGYKFYIVFGSRNAQYEATDIVRVSPDGTVTTMGSFSDFDAYGRNAAYLTTTLDGRYIIGMNGSYNVIKIYDTLLNSFSVLSITIPYGSSGIIDNNSKFIHAYYGEIQVYDIATDTLLNSYPIPAGESPQKTMFSELPNGTMVKSNYTKKFYSTTDYSVITLTTTDANLNGYDLSTLTWNKGNMGHRMWVYQSDRMIEVDFDPLDATKLVAVGNEVVLTDGDVYNVMDSVYFEDTISIYQWNNTVDHREYLTTPEYGEYIVPSKSLSPDNENISNNSFVFSLSDGDSYSELDSILLGKGVGTNAPNSTAMGTYNIGQTDTILEVGIGSDTNNRANGLEVKQDGEILAPNTSVIDNKSLVTKEYLLDTSHTYSAPQIGTVITEDLTVDLSAGNNFAVTGSGVVAFTNQVVGQGGVIVITSAEAITGWGTEVSFGSQGVPTDLSGTETFAYFVSASSGDGSIKIGRL